MRRLDLLLIPVLLNNLCVFTGDVERDLRRAIGKHIFGKRELIHSLGGKDKGDPVFPALGK
jgi:hypothetical protein